MKVDTELLRTQLKARIGALEKEEIGGKTDVEERTSRYSAALQRHLPKTVAAVKTELARFEKEVEKFDYAKYAKWAVERNERLAGGSPPREGFPQFTPKYNYMPDAPENKKRKAIRLTPGVSETPAYVLHQCRIALKHLNLVEDKKVEVNSGPLKDIVQYL